MNSVPNNEKIEKYLDELADEYKKLLFNALISRSNNFESLSVSELLRLDNEIKRPLLENNRTQRRFRKTLQVTGLTYMLIGFILFISSNFNYQDLYGTRDIVPLFSLILGFIGVLLSIFSFMLPTFFHSPIKGTYKSNNLRFLEYKIVIMWRELEGIVNDITINTDVEEPRSIIDFLLSNKLINDNELILLKKFLKIRNSIVHSIDYQYSIQELETLIKKVDNIISKLKKY